MPSSGNRIEWVNDGTLGTEVHSTRLYDYYGSYSDTYKVIETCLLCSNSFAVWGRYFALTIYVYNRTAGSWEPYFNRTYIDSNSSAVAVNFDISRLPSGSPALHSLLGNGDFIHYALVLEGQERSSTEAHVVMGSYLTMPQSHYNAYAKGKHIYGKKGTAIADAFRAQGHSPVESAEDLNWRVPDPFLSEWGDITSARGQPILASQPHRLVAFEF